MKDQFEDVFELVNDKEWPFQEAWVKDNPGRSLTQWREESVSGKLFHILYATLEALDTLGESINKEEL